jgi:uncharacterized protein (TIGR02145 family)
MKFNWLTGKILLLLFLISTIIFPKCKPEEILKLTKIQTGSISNITDTSAIASATFSEIGDNLGNYGHCWSTNQNPSITDNKTTLHGNISSLEFSSNIEGLTPKTKYYVRAWAKDGNQIIYGNQIEFSTSETPFISILSPITGNHWMGGEVHPILWTDNFDENVDIILLKNGVFNRNIASNITSNGQYDWTIPNDLAYDSDYQIQITNVNNINLTAISGNFKASEQSGTVNNLIYWGITYNTIKIGTQWWMAQNLKTSKYSDGTDIPYITTSWVNVTSPAYRDYATTEYNNSYGALYNWYVANTGILCPAGWHIPTEQDWSTLAVYCGGSDLAGIKLKEAGTSHWTTPNTRALNESGFTGLPGGYYLTTFAAIGSYGCWWSNTSTDQNNARVYSLNYNNTWLNNNTNSKKSGASVRCVRD